MAGLVFVQTAFALPIDHFDAVLRWAHEVLPTLDRRVEPVIVGTRVAPEGVDIDGAPMMIMLATGLFDSQDEADRLMRPLQGCPGLDDAYMREFATPVTFDIVSAIQETMSPSGHRYAADCVWTDATADELAPLLRDLYTSLPTPQSFTIWYGWNPVRPLPDMAFSMEANVYVATYAVWSDPADDTRVLQWMSDRYRALEPVSKGTYLGDADLLRRPAPFMAEDNFQRLAAIRDEYDPQRRFPDFRVKPGTMPNEFERAT